MHALLFFTYNLNKMNSLFSVLFLSLFSATAVGPVATTTSSPQPILSENLNRTLSTIKVCTGKGEAKECTRTDYADGADCFILIQDGTTVTSGDDC